MPKNEKIRHNDLTERPLEDTEKLSPRELFNRTVGESHKDDFRAEKTVIEITGAFAPETVENLLELVMERMATLRVTDFTVETRQTSDEELLEELDADIFYGSEMTDFSIFGVENADRMSKIKVWVSVE